MTDKKPQTTTKQVAIDRTTMKRLNVFRAEKERTIKEVVDAAINEYITNHA